MKRHNVVKWAGSVTVNECPDALAARLQAVRCGAAKTLPEGEVLIVAKKAATATRTFDDVIRPHPKKTQAMAKRLRKLVLKALANPEEQIVGGAKVGLALYTDGETNSVMCGVHPSGDKCLLYVHHIADLKHPRLKLEGEGKRARHIKFHSIKDIKDEDVRFVLSEVEKRALRPKE
jgi:hypothetical protein